MSGPSRAFLSRAGTLGLVAGLLAPPLVAVMLLWPPAVAPGPLHYPFTRTGFFVVQSGFFVHHIGQVVLLLGVALSGAVGSHRLFRGAAWLALAGMTALTLAELNAMRYVDWDTQKANEGAMGAVYGIACTSIGIGLLVAGIGALRARVWSGWHRWTLLAIGIATFVELTPGMFGGFVIARLAIGFWILLFAALGQSLRAESIRVRE